MYENTLIPAHTTGTYGGTPLTNGANYSSTGSGNAIAATTDLITDGWTATTTVLKAGDIITIGDVYEVHPETKGQLGRLEAVCRCVRYHDRWFRQQHHYHQPGHHRWRCLPERDRPRC